MPHLYRKAKSSLEKYRLTACYRILANNYRLITRIYCADQTITLYHFLTRKEYDREKGQIPSEGPDRVRRSVLPGDRPSLTALLATCTGIVYASINGDQGPR